MSHSQTIIISWKGTSSKFTNGVDAAPSAIGIEEWLNYVDIGENAKLRTAAVDRVNTPSSTSARRRRPSRAEHVVARLRPASGSRRQFGNLNPSVHARARPADALGR